MPRTLKPRPELRALNLDLKDPIQRREYKKLYLRIYRKERPEYFRSISKVDYQKHRKKRLDASNKWRKENHERVIKRKREHYAENQERLVNEKRKRYRVDPEKYKAQARKSNKKHRTKILQKKKKEFQDYRLNVLTYYSKGTPKCKNCGVSGVPFLNIDHIYGRRQMGHSRNMGTLKLYRYLHKEHPTGYQVLCYTCNMLKEVKRREKVHKQSPMAIKRRRQRQDTKEFVLRGYSRGKPKCACCGFSNFNGLALDHIYGRKQMGHSRDFGSDDLRMALKKEYKKTGKWPSGFQVLCHNCNSAKSDTGICPHKF